MTLESPSRTHDRRRRVMAIGAPVGAAAVVVATALAGGAVGGHAASRHPAGHAPAGHAISGAPRGTFAAAAAPSGPPQFIQLGYTSPALGGGLARPDGIAAANGTIYVANTGANEVGEIAGGATTIIAGTLSNFGEHGDGGPGNAATLYQPGGLAADAAGDVFIADSGDSAVREVTPDGVITRVAGTGRSGAGRLGGQARTTALNYPEGLAADSAGNLYIADTNNNRVIRVNRFGQTFLVAGTGQAGFSGDGGRATSARLDEPSGVALDARGNIYIADSSNNVIRRVSKSGIITTVAGDFAADLANDGLGGFSGDGGPATSAQLNDPQGVAVDGAGDLFIADTFNNAVREVTAAGIISTVVNKATANGGPPATGFETPGGDPTATLLATPYQVSIDPSTDDLYIADTHNGTADQVTNLAAPGDAAGPVAPAKS